MRFLHKEAQRTKRRARWWKKCFLQHVVHHDLQLVLLQCWQTNCVSYGCLLIINEFDFVVKLSPAHKQARRQLIGEQFFLIVLVEPMNSFIVRCNTDLSLRDRYPSPNHSTLIIFIFLIILKNLYLICHLNSEHNNRPLSDTLLATLSCHDSFDQLSPLFFTCVYLCVRERAFVNEEKIR